MVTSDSVGPGTSMPWNSPTVANRHEVSSPAKRGEERRLGQVVLGEDVKGSAGGAAPSAASTMARRLVNSASVRPPAAAMSASQLVVALPAWWPGWRGSGRWAAQ